MALPVLAALGIGAGASLLGSLFSDDSDYQARLSAQIQDLREDQKAFYGEAFTEIEGKFGEVLNNFNARIDTARANMLARYPGKQQEIADLFSVKNPAIADYVENLKDVYKDTEGRVYSEVKRANMDEIRRLNQQGVTGGDIGRMLAGNQMTRLSKGEEILTQKMGQVLAPQAQLAQQGAQAQYGHLMGTEAGLRGLDVTQAQGGAQIGTQGAGALAGLAGQNLSTQAQIGMAGLEQPPPAGGGGIGGLFEEAGSQFMGAGIEKFIADYGRK